MERDHILTCLQENHNNTAVGIFCLSGTGVDGLTDCCLFVVGGRQIGRCWGFFFHALFRLMDVFILISLNSHRQCRQQESRIELLSRMKLRGINWTRSIRQIMKEREGRRRERLQPICVSRPRTAGLKRGVSPERKRDEVGRALPHQSSSHKHNGPLIRLFGHTHSCLIVVFLF